MSKRDYVGNSISVGQGIKSFFHFQGSNLIPEPAADATEATKNLYKNGLVLEIGILNDLQASTQRTVAPQFIPGDRNAISFNTGTRLTSGKISFSVVDQDFISYFLDLTIEGVRQNQEEMQIEAANGTSLFGTIIDPTKPDDYIKPKKIKYLDQLPPVDIVMIGTAEHIHSMSAEGSSRTPFQLDIDYKMDAVYKCTIKNVRFMNDNFGFQAGAPLQDQVLDFIASSIEPWKRV